MTPALACMTLVLEWPCRPCTLPVTLVLLGTCLAIQPWYGSAMLCYGTNVVFALDLL